MQPRQISTNSIIRFIDGNSVMLSQCEHRVACTVLATMRPASPIWPSKYSPTPPGLKRSCAGIELSPRLYFEIPAYRAGSSRQEVLPIVRIVLGVRRKLERAITIERNGIREHGARAALRIGRE